MTKWDDESFHDDVDELDDNTVYALELPNTQEKLHNKSSFDTTVTEEMLEKAVLNALNKWQSGIENRPSILDDIEYKTGKRKRIGLQVDDPTLKALEKCRKILGVRSRPDALQEVVWRFLREAKRVK